MCLSPLPLILMKLQKISFKTRGKKKYITVWKTRKRVMSEAAFVRNFSKELISINMIEKPDKSMYSREKAVAEVVAALLSGALREL